MRIVRFEMERTQCLYENQVEYNLSESGVWPLRVEEVLEGDEEPGRFLSTHVKYPQSNGTEILRDRIAAFYAGAKRDNVLVTNGGSQANYTALWSLLEPTDRLACMLPNYLQAWGLGQIYGQRSDAFRLVEKREGGRARWALDLDSLERAVGRKTRVIVVTNPNNPTGAVLSEEEMEAIVRAARRANAWILSDEIYRGAELSGPLSPTFWGRYDKLLITSGLSKAFGLPGLRIGWVVGPPKTIDRFWGYQDYITLTPGILSDRLAGIVMEPARRERALERTRSIVRRQWPLLERWIRSHADVLTCVPPQAGAIATIGYKLPIPSVRLFDKLREEKSVLITPGAHFGIGKYVRIGFGYDAENMLKGLERIDQTIAEIRAARPVRAARRVRETPRARAKAAGTGGRRRTPSRVAL
jgi:hypothetical protein